MGNTKVKTRFGVVLQTKEHGRVSPLPTPECIINGDYEVVELEIYENDVLKAVIEVKGNHAKV